MSFEARTTPSGFSLDFDMYVLLEEAEQVSSKSSTYHCAFHAVSMVIALTSYCTSQSVPALVNVEFFYPPILAPFIITAPQSHSHPKSCGFLEYIS